MTLIAAGFVGGLAFAPSWWVADVTNDFSDAGEDFCRLGVKLALMGSSLTPAGARYLLRCGGAELAHR